MGSDHHKISFESSGRVVKVAAETTLLEAAAQAGITLHAPCGGQGTCGKCRVRVLGADELACQFKVRSELVVEIPPESEHGVQSILTSGQSQETTLNPTVIYETFEFSEPTREDAQSDLERLRKVIGARQVAPHLLQQLPAILRAHGWRGGVLMNPGHLLALEPPDLDKRILGVAVDAGTTTVVATLMDLTEGRELGVAAELNPQIAMGCDVM